jgi:aromatic ring-opening dioxygenase LigB subunit
MLFLKNLFPGLECVFDVISGKDERDSTTRDISKKSKDAKKIIIGIPAGIGCDKKIADLINKKVIGLCKKNGWNEKTLLWLVFKHINK